MRSASLGKSGQSRTPPSPPPRASGRGPAGKGRPMPDRAAVRRRGAPEKRLMWQAKRALEQLGCDVTLFSQPFRARQTRGIPDMYVRHPRWRVRLWVEWKAGRNDTTAHQAAWIAAERAAGGHAIVARSLEDVLRALRELGAPIDL